MTEREQFHRVCQWNRELIRENSRLREDLGRVAQEGDGLRAANAELRVERDAADLLLGAAMDEALQARPL